MRLPLRSALLTLLLACHREDVLVTATVQCGTNVGECRSGFLQDLPDGGQVCYGAIGPMPEICDGLDNDCDGFVDDNLGDLGYCTSQCYPGGENRCIEGVLQCVPFIQPMPEVCNGRDDNCDGIIDNVIYDGGDFCYTGPPGTDGNGICHPGLWHCTNGHQTCSDQTPMPEVCDGIDNDCNGKVDDGIICDRPKDLRITASWNYPNDFDIHLLDDKDGGVLDNGYWSDGWNTSPDDCYYSDMNPVWSSNPAENPSLAFDDLFGPNGEVTTMQQMSTHDHYTVGLHLYSWKSAPTQATVTVKVYCGGNMLIDRSLTLDEWAMWRVGRIWYLPGDPCHWEELGDGGMTF